MKYVTSLYQRIHINTANAKQQNCNFCKKQRHVKYLGQDKSIVCFLFPDWNLIIIVYS